MLRMYRSVLDGVALGIRPRSSHALWSEDQRLHVDPPAKALAHRAALGINFGQAYASAIAVRRELELE